MGMTQSLGNSGLRFTAAQPHYYMYSRTQRPSRGGSSRRYGAARPSHGRPLNRSQVRGRPQRSAHKGQHIDFSRFVNKAIITEAQEIYTPEHRFEDFAITEHLKKNITAKGYVVPTPIQDKAIPHVLLGHDVVGIANTGTGKTAAFLIPLINKVLGDRKQKVLIMVPTRELAQQIEEEYWGFASHMRIGAVTCVGGANINKQIAGLRRHPNFVIGTPGRLKDLMERRALHPADFPAAPRAAWISPTYRTSSTTIFRPPTKITCTASGAPVAQASGAKHSHSSTKIAPHCPWRGLTSPWVIDVLAKS